MIRKLTYLFILTLALGGCQRKDIPPSNKAMGDSPTHAIPVLTANRTDSIHWYGYQVSHKRQLGESDSAIHYLKEAIRLQLAIPSRAYGTMGQIYQDKQMNDSAIYFYFLALQTDTTRSAYWYCGKVLELLRSLKEYDKAKAYIQGLRQQMKRTDIPYINLVEGDLWVELHQPDSAMKHYLIASETGNDYITSVAYERLALLMEENRTLSPAIEKHIQSIKLRSNLHNSYHGEQSTRDFEALKLKNEVNELKVEQQNYIILILSLCAFILLLSGGFVIYLLHRNRNRLVQENLILKQQEELSALREKEALLREKDARMREELFRRVRIENLKDGKHIQHISDDDWK